MKKIITVFVLLFGISAFAWGPTGHRVVGEIAYLHLTKKAKKNIAKVMGTESLAISSNWMDFIKSDHSYDSLSSWHYVTIPSLEKYHHENELKGDVVQAIVRFKQELETDNYSIDELFALRCLVHLVGDIHQPLHVGNGEDQGGNNVKVTWFGKRSNLHRVWDTEIIDGQKLSYSEYTAWVNTATKDQISKWQKDPITIWIKESIFYRESIYDFPETGKLGYRYSYDHVADVNLRLLQAGIRLAGVLNKIYG